MLVRGDNADNEFDVGVTEDYEAEDTDAGLSRREDSGIVNAEVQTPAGSSTGDASTGDAAVSSSSSGDGEVMVVRQADVVVHTVDDATPTEPSANGLHMTDTRRRTSTDSTDRSVSNTRFAAIS